MTVFRVLPVPTVVFHTSHKKYYNCMRFLRKNKYAFSIKDIHALQFYIKKRINIKHPTKDEFNSKCTTFEMEIQNQATSVPF